MATWECGDLSCTLYKVADKCNGQVVGYRLIGGVDEVQFIARFSTSVQEPKAKGNLRELGLAVDDAPDAVRRVLVACGWPTKGA